MKRIPHKFRPICEALEGRLTPAGSVTATFTGTSLTITGDANDNDITITQGTDDLLTITANGTTTVRLNNGLFQNAVTLPTPVTGGVTINMGDGADIVTIDGVDLPSFLTINGGNGDAAGQGNQLLFQNGVYVSGNVNITNLSGSDTTTFFNVTSVTGNLSINNGSGSAFANDSNAAGQETVLNVTGAFVFINGTGNESVELGDGLEYNFGSISINTGSDNSFSFIDISPNGDLTVGGNVQVSNGPGGDFVNIGSGNVASFGGAVNVNNGNAGPGGSTTNLFGFSRLTTGSVTVVNGTGADNVAIFAQGGAASIHSNVAVNNGIGGSNTQVSAFTDLAISGNVAITNGTGFDQVSVFGTTGNLAITGGVNINNGDGGSFTNIACNFDAANSVFVAGSVSVTNGAGFDQVNIGNNVAATRVNGNIQVSNGNGNGPNGSQTTIQGGRLTVNGGVRVTSLIGTDGVIITTAVLDGAIGGGVTVNLGDGNNQSLTISAQTNGTFLAIGQPLTLTPGLSIITADSTLGGSDQIQLLGVKVQSDTIITTGAGDDGITIDDSFFNGGFTLTTNAGFDSVNIEQSGSAGTTRFRGPVAVRTGADDDTVNVGNNNASVDQAVFALANTWDGGAGLNDQLNLLNFGNIFYVNPTILGFETVN